MKIAVIGGAGFIGSHLTRAYIEAGHSVLVIDSLINGMRETIDARARFYHLDIRDARVDSILQLERPDIVSYHVIHRQHTPTEQAITDADVHIRGLLNMLDSSVNAGVGRFIFASGGNDLYRQSTNMHQLITEDAPLYPRHAQDISKLAGEWYVRYYTQQHGLKHTILRYADVYGSLSRSSHPHPLSYFMSMLLEQRRPVIRGKGDTLRDHIHIHDVITANLNLLKRGENRTLHISSGQGYSLNQLYHMVAASLESKIEPIHLADPWGETSATVLDNLQAQHHLGWTPEVSLTEGIQQLLTQYPQQQKRQEPQHTQVSREPMPVDASETTREATLTRV